MAIIMKLTDSIITFSQQLLCKRLFISACSTTEFSLTMSVVRTRATIDTHIAGGFEQVQQGICRLSFHACRNSQADLR